MGMRMLEAMGRQTLKIPFSQQTQFLKVSWICWDDVFLLYGQTWCNVSCHTCEVTLVLKVSLAWSCVNFVLVVLRELMRLGSCRAELGSWGPLRLLKTPIQFFRNQSKQCNLWVFAPDFLEKQFHLHNRRPPETGSWPRRPRNNRGFLLTLQQRCMVAPSFAENEMHLLLPLTVVSLQALEESPKERKLTLVENECHEIELEILSFLQY